MAISGQRFWHSTEFGKALAEILPPQVERVIIDIPIQGMVRIYYQSFDVDKILDLKWGDVLPKIEIVDSNKDPAAHERST